MNLNIHSITNGGLTPVDFRETLKGFSRNRTLLEILLKL